jgi:phosphohistidine phosphatase
MKKTLYLVRHAKSSWKHAGLSDSDRPLNKRGKKDAPLMGKLLRQRGEIPQLLISSTAKRALSTAKHFAEELHYPKNKILIYEELYMAGINDFFGVIENTDKSINSIMVFSHNPGITDLVNFLSGSDIENVPTSGTARIDFNAGSWKDIKKTKGELKFLISPKMLNNKMQN